MLYNYFKFSNCWYRNIQMKYYLVSKYRTSKNIWTTWEYASLEGNKCPTMDFVFDFGRCEIFSF